MIAYVDASVLLRVVLRQPNSLPEWGRINRGISSALIATESLRTLDRLRLRAQLSDAEIAVRRQAILAVIASLELIEIDAAVLDRAAQPDAYGTGYPRRDTSCQRAALAGNHRERACDGDSRSCAGAWCASAWNENFRHSFRVRASVSPFSSGDTKRPIQLRRFSVFQLPA
jgi:hypothetical protein